MSSVSSALREGKQSWSKEESEASQSGKVRQPGQCQGAYCTVGWQR